MDSRIGRIIGYLPMILVIAVACSNSLAAAWSCWGVNIFLNLTDMYRTRYNPKISFPNWLHFSAIFSTTLIVILVMSIHLDPLLFGPIVISTLTCAVLLSLISGHPFTYQQSAHQVSEEVRTSPQFLKVNYILTTFWLLLFSVMTICVWCSYAFCDATCKAQTTCSLVLGTIIPIAVPVLGFLLTPYLVNFLKSQAHGKKSDSLTGVPGQGEKEIDSLLASS